MTELTSSAKQKKPSPRELEQIGDILEHLSDYALRLLHYHPMAVADLAFNELMVRQVRKSYKENRDAGNRH